MIRVESNPSGIGQPAEVKCYLHLCTDEDDTFCTYPANNLYSWRTQWTEGTYKGKMQFIHWCDDNWEKLMEKPLEQQKSGVGSESDFLTKSYDMGVDFGKSEPTQTHLIKIVEKQLPENCKNTIGHFEFTHNGGIFKKYKNLQINLTINYQDKAYTITTPSGGNFIFKNTKNNNLELVKLLQQAVTFAQRELGIK
jgi:hypothetical protein